MPSQLIKRSQNRKKIRGKEKKVPFQIIGRSEQERREGEGREYKIGKKKSGNEKVRKGEKGRWDREERR